MKQDPRTKPDRSPAAPIQEPGPSRPEHNQTSRPPLILDEEREVLRALAEAYNLFSALPPLHSVDKDEFRAMIHHLQNIVLARPALREES